MIDFELPEKIQNELRMAQMVAEHVMRPASRHFDEHEHEIPWDYINAMWSFMRDTQQRRLDRDPSQRRERTGPGTGNIRMIHMVEMFSWGDAGLYLCTPSAALAGAAIEAVGTPEQQQRLLRRFAEDPPKWGAMAMTEPGAGSDTAAIKTTARLDEETNEWVLNGEKIFITGGRLAFEQSEGLIVVWATVDPSAGRAGMKPFVVEAGTPGAQITKVEDKLGIRASDTAALVLKDCRIPYDNILGSAEVRRRDGSKAGFKGAMATFDASRPIVAASALGVARAAIDLTQEKLTEEGIEIRYGEPRHALSAVERDVLEMEAQYKAAWLLTLRAASMMDHRQPNTLEASMCKVKAGQAVTWITQKAVEILGPLGYSRELLAEKWMRDGKINDIFEGTGQINTLIVARRLLGYGSRDLR
ncbi:MAG: acyl-CoA dehydrogenase family protein [Anaerolineae bacterium]